jgi:hypothetical protein
MGPAQRAHLKLKPEKMYVCSRTHFPEVVAHEMTKKAFCPFCFQRNRRHLIRRVEFHLDRFLCMGRRRQPPLQNGIGFNAFNGFNDFNVLNGINDSFLKFDWQAHF